MLVCSAKASNFLTKQLDLLYNNILCYDVMYRLYIIDVNVNGFKLKANPTNCKLSKMLLHHKFSSQNN